MFRLQIRASSLGISKTEKYVDSYVQYGIYYQYFHEMWTAMTTAWIDAVLLYPKILILILIKPQRYLSAIT